MSYTFELKIEAQTKDEAVSKMQSVCDLLNGLNEKELDKLAHVVKNEPLKQAIARKALGL